MHIPLTEHQPRIGLPEVAKHPQSLGRRERMERKMERQTGTRVTDWCKCADGPWYPSLPHGGFVAYRIWQQFDGLRWFQRHEWKYADGSTRMDDWINGVASWSADAAPVEEAA